MEPNPIESLVHTALRAARAAAQVQRSMAGRLDANGGREKGHRDFVSEVDLRAQRAALSEIRARHPHHHVLAEEEDGEPGEGWGGGDAPPGVPTWIVDPLDGTTNYLHGHPLHCASVGVVADGVLLAGAVVAPVTGEAWWAGRGLGAFRSPPGEGLPGALRGVPVRVSAVRDPSLALVGTGFPFKHPHHLPRYLEGLGRVLQATSGVRRCGSAALDLCYLAQGSLDAFWEFFLSPWDVAAGLIILSEAGGIYRRMEGGPFRVEEAGSLLAANGPELLEALGGMVGTPA